MAVLYPEMAMATLGDLSLEVFTAAFALAGLPFIAFGVLGVWQRDEVPLRSYYFYLILAAIVATVFLIDASMVVNCQSIPREFRAGGAFFCGIVEVVDVTLVAVLV